MEALEEVVGALEETEVKDSCLKKLNGQSYFFNGIFEKAYSLVPAVRRSILSWFPT